MDRVTGPLTATGVYAVSSARARPPKEPPHRTCQQIRVASGLPLALGSARGVPCPDGDSPPPRGRRAPVSTISVLLVEDDADIATLLRLCLDPSRYAVAWVETLAEASAALARTRPEVAVVDIGLPDGNGLDLCRAIKARHADVRIVVITAGQTGQSRRDALRAGADRFVAKPFDPDDLCAVVDDLAAAP
jgi:CheY-like chemotaxis protein